MTTSVSFPPGRWQAHWIWPEATPGMQGRRTAAMRVDLDVDAVPRAVPVRVVADARYVLTVNGTEVGRGPSRGNPRQRRVDVVDLAAHLRPGRNVVAALVAFYGTPRPWWMPVPFNTGEVQAGGFVLEAHPDTGIDLRTGANWVGTLLEGWADGDGGGLSGRWVEVVDLRSLPPGWDRPGTPQPDWPAVRELRANTTGEPGDPRPRAYPMGPLPPRRTTAPTTDPVPLRRLGPETWVADRIVVGSLTVDVEGPPGATVTLTTGEFLDGDQLRPGPHQEGLGARVVTDGTSRTIETVDAYGLHGVAVSGTGDAVVHSITVNERLHPVTGDADFSCADPLLDEIWQVGRRTVSICSLDAYVDCPTREQRAWTGDSVVHQMVDLTTNTDWTLARWHPRLTASPRADGMLPMAVGGDIEIADLAVIPDWALHWIHSLHNLYRYIGDRDEVAELLPVAENVLRWFTPYAGEDGVPEDVTGWVIIDWASVCTEGASAALAGLLGRALVEFAEMAEWLSDTGRATWARAWHRRLRDGFERFWDPGRQVYVDHVVGGVPQRPMSQHAQAAAIVGRLAPEDRWPRLVELLTDKDRHVHATFSVPDREATPNGEFEVGGDYLRAGQPAPWWDVEHQLVAAQPFFRYVVHDALADAGHADLIAAHCRDWATALERCRTSWTETWFGGTVSHAWSSTPTRDLVQRVLGVEPAQPGFAVARIDPHLGDLQWARGTVPTPAGPLRIEVTTDKVVLDTPIPAMVDGQRVPPGAHTIQRGRQR